MLATGFISVVISIEKALSGKALASKDIPSSCILVTDIEFDPFIFTSFNFNLIPFRKRFDFFIGTIVIFEITIVLLGCNLNVKKISSI